LATTKPGIDYSYLVQEDRVHGSIYTSREIFEEEMERIFKRMWVYVGHTSEIPQPGDYRVTWIGDESVIMTRDEDGQIHLPTESPGSAMSP
jgi:fatty-acyl-CoA synthase